MIFAIRKPPVIKQTVAIREGNCKLDSPEMACPDVHPSAYLVPNPIRNPPSTIIINPFIVNKFSQLNSSKGTSALKL